MLSTPAALAFDAASTSPNNLTFKNDEDRCAGPSSNAMDGLVKVDANTIVDKPSSSVDNSRGETGGVVLGRAICWCRGGLEGGDVRKHENAGNQLTQCR